MTKLNKFLENLKSKKIHVVGVAGTEGSEIAIFLSKHGLANVTLHDFSENSDAFEAGFLKSHQNFDPEIKSNKLEKLKNLNYTLNFKSNYLKGIVHADLIFVPQSWYLYPQNEILKKLKQSIEFSSLTRLYLELIPAKKIGITGSNGKSTTTFLTYHLLQNFPTGKVYLTGNDRRAPQLLDILETIQPNDILVTEISNRQLVDTDGLSPDIAIITNITENHLSEHADIAEYTAIKAKIFNYQDSSSDLILNLEDPISQIINFNTRDYPGKKHLFGSQNFQDTAECYYNQDQIYLNQKPLIQLKNLLLSGDHNYQNTCAAIIAASLAGQTIDNLKANLSTFKGLPQRQELVGTFKGLSFYDDRQGTAIEATLSALRSLPSPLTVILGGQNKGMSTEPLIELINQNSITVVGITSPFLEELKPNLKTLQVEVENIDQAVAWCYQNLEPNSHIVFSPACEYGPYFNGRPHQENSENFKDLVLQLGS